MEQISQSLTQNYRNYVLKNQLAIMEEIKEKLLPFDFVNLASTSKSLSLLLNISSIKYLIFH